MQDVCPNLSGVQTQVPLGFGVVNGNCVADVCPNLGGVQTTVPRGFRKVSGKCVKPTDVCPNLAGAQAQAAERDGQGRRQVRQEEDRREEGEEGEEAAEDLLPERPSGLTLRARQGLEPPESHGSRKPSLSA